MSGPRKAVRRRHIFVDEYQDTDPAQVRLLEALAGDGRELVVVGDPDQSVYAFRGADLHGILEFPDRFRTPDDQPARIIALGTCRRSGPALLAASRRIAARLPAPPAAAPAARRPPAREPTRQVPHRASPRRCRRLLPSGPRPAAGRPS